MIRPLSVLLVCPMVPSPSLPGAIPRELHALVTGLHARHRLTVVSVAGPDPDEIAAAHDLAREGFDVRAAVRTEPRTRAERWSRRGRLAHSWGVRRLPWRSAWYWEPSVQRAIDRRLSEGPVDVVQAEDNASGQYRLRHPASIITEHEVRRPRPMSLELHHPSPGHILAEIDWRRWPGYERRVWSRFARIQTFTQRDADLVGRIAPELAPRVRVNPFGLVIPPACRVEAEEPGALLFIGNYTHPPNVDAALWLGREIVPALRRSDPRVHLHLVGDGAPDAVRALHGAGITVHGRVPDPRPFFERAQLVVAPIRIGNGMRMKVLEAMASGKAVVSTTRGLEGLNGAGAGLADDTASFVRTTAALLADDATRVRMGRSSRAYAVAHHSPEAYVARLEATYRELVPTAG